MTVDIRQALLHYPENSRFQLLGETPEIIGELGLNLNLAALSKSLNVPPESRSESRLIQNRRIKQVRDGTHLLAHFLHDSLTLAQGVGCLGKSLDVSSHG